MTNEPSNAAVTMVMKEIRKQARAMYRTHFFRTMTMGEFDLAWKLAIERIAIQWRRDQQ